LSLYNQRMKSLEVLKPGQLRNSDLSSWQVMEKHNAIDTVRHRRVVIETSAEEATLFKHIFDLSKVEGIVNSPSFQDKFPSFQKAIWVFERAPRDKKIKITSIVRIYREHTQVSFTTENASGLTTEKSVIFKVTTTARMERMMAQAANIVGLPSYRVLSVDGMENEGASWSSQIVGQEMSDETGEMFPIEKVVALLPSKYAVIQKIDGQTAMEFRGKLFMLTPEQQVAFLRSLAANLAGEFLFALTDQKEEHFIVNPQTYELTRIDREQSLRSFSDAFRPTEFWFTSFRSGLPIAEQKNAFRVGVQLVADQAELKRKDVAELFRRNANFGIAGKEVPIVEARMMNVIEKQLRILQEWVAEQRWN
jgi:hypothetical protein